MEGPVVWQPLLKTPRVTPNRWQVPVGVLFVHRMKPPMEILFVNPRPSRVTFCLSTGKVHRIRTDLTLTVRDVWREDANTISSFDQRLQRQFK